jgi:hypothetical protein
MKKSIYDVYVRVTSQEQADRLKGICLEYGLPISDFKDSFDFEIENKEMYLRTSIATDCFFVSNFQEQRTPITESEFEQLAKKFK